MPTPRPRTWDRRAPGLAQELHRAPCAARDALWAASETYDWDVDIVTVAWAWRGGCMLLLAASIATGLVDRQDSWCAVVAAAVQAGVPVAGVSSALAYYDTVRAERLPAALLQGLRDDFGARTYERLDKGGTSHTLAG